MSFDSIRNKMSRPVLSITARKLLEASETIMKKATVSPSEAEHFSNAINVTISDIEHSKTFGDIKENEINFCINSLERMIRFVPFHHIETDNERADEIHVWCNESLRHYWDCIWIKDHVVFMVQHTDDQLLFKMRWQ